MDMRVLHSHTWYGFDFWKDLLKRDEIIAAEVPKHVILLILAEQSDSFTNAIIKHKPQYSA
jgi:hypothetical protein